jgi:hypothetical protein
MVVNGYRRAACGWRHVTSGVWRPVTSIQYFIQSFIRSTQNASYSINGYRNKYYDKIV